MSFSLSCHRFSYIGSFPGERADGTSKKRNFRLLASELGLCDAKTPTKSGVSTSLAVWRGKGAVSMYTKRHYLCCPGSVFGDIRNHGFIRVGFACFSNFFGNGVQKITSHSTIFLIFQHKQALVWGFERRWVADLVTQF